MRDISDVIKATEEAFDFQKSELEGTKTFDSHLCEENKMEAVVFIRMRVEAKPKQIKKFGERLKIGSCPYCHLNVFDPYNFCPNCGKALKWEE